MNRTTTTFPAGLLLAMVLALVCAVPGLADEQSEGMTMDHSGHDMGAMGAERDELGRRLHGMKHEITPEVANEIRAKVSLYKDFSDAEIALAMQNMGPNYEWFISKPDVQGEQGVLLLMHGFRDRGDKAFKERMQPIADVFPTAMAAGMSMMMSDHIQWAVRDLESAGAKTIVVVPIVSTEFNTMLRQWEYIFGLRDESEYVAVPRVKTDAKIVMASPPNDDPLVAEILLDHALELSTNPENEVVIIVAHGPSFDEDNKRAMQQLANLARYMSEDSDFSEITGLTLQDDAPREVRAANVARLRAMVEKAASEGKDVLIVSNLIGTFTIQAKLRKDLKGLDYKFNRKGIIEHDAFMKWLLETIHEGFRSSRKGD